MHINVGHWDPITGELERKISFQRPFYKNYHQNDSCNLMKRKTQALFFPFETTPREQHFLISSSIEGISLLSVAPHGGNMLRIPGRKPITISGLP